MLYVPAQRKFADNARCRCNEDHNDNDEKLPADSSLASRREHRTVRMPAGYVVNHGELASEGERNPIMLLLDGEIDELQVELDRSPTNIPDVQQAHIDIETTYVNASLTEPIDDADAHDPVTIV